jgi:hypothetical protein
MRVSDLVAEETQARTIYPEDIEVARGKIKEDQAAEQVGKTKTLMAVLGPRLRRRIV